MLIVFTVIGGGCVIVMSRRLVAGVILLFALGSAFLIAFFSLP
jgi:hypothetical protein